MTRSIAALLCASALAFPAAAWGQSACVSPGCGTPNFDTLSLGGTGAVGTGKLTLQNTGNGGVPVLGGTFIGDTNHMWFQGAIWGFGVNPISNTGQNNTAPVLTVQRVGSYSGAITGNPSALSVINTIGASVTGAETGMTLTMNDSAAAGIHTAIQPTINKLTVGNSTQFGGNTVVTDKTGRMSSVAGAIVGHEFDVIAAGPDDGAVRINLDLIGREFPGGSADGATTIQVAGARARGQTVQGGAPGVINTPSTSLYGFRTQTLTDIGTGSGHGQIMAFGTSFASDGASTAAFSAASATQTMLTNASAIGGATTLKLATTNDRNTDYIWPGALVTGTNIAANTHVLTQSYDANVTITITIDKPTSGAVANGATLTFTNAIGTAFTASGYIATAAFQSPNFLVDPAGIVTGASYKAGATAGVTCSGSPTASFASTGGLVTHC